MPSANVIRQVKRWVALTFFIGLHVMCVWVVLTNTIAAFLRNSPLVGLVATLLFVALVSLASMTLTATVRKEAGIPVWWHSCTSIEALVRGVVTECVETNSGANHANASNGGTLRDDHEEDVTRKANEAASRVLEFERQVAAQPMQDVVVRPKAKNSLEYDDVNDYEDTSAVRGLKNHLGLDVVTMGDVARAALERLNSHDGSVMGEEVSYLLDGAKCCKICNVYKLDGTHHCSSCGHCVAQMDHHCTWIGQCIGRENHKYFLLYLGYMTLLTSYTSILTASALAKEWIYFAQAGMEPKPMSLMVFMLCISFAVVLIPFTIQSVADAGCGDSLIMIFQRERRQQVEREAQRAATPATGESGVRVYAPLFQEGAEDTEAAVAARQNVSSFSVENLQRVFGIGRRLPDWLLPMSPMWPPEHGAMEEAQRRLKELVRHQLEAATDAGHSTAVSVPVRVPE